MPQKLSERTRLVVNRYGDGESFAKKFNPSLQVVCAQNVERSFKGNAPSLALLGETYPDEQVNTWIIAQLMDLYKFAGVKEKPTFQQVLELSVMIRVEYYYLKASELLLFFFKLKAGEYGIISRVSFSSSRGSVISMCRYREMIYGEGCEELELSRIGEIIGIAKAIDVVEADDSKLDISVESRVPPEKTIGKARKSLKIQVFLVVRSSFFARQIPLVFYSSLDWEMFEQEKSSRDPPKESTLGKEMKS